MSFYFIFTSRYNLLIKGLSIKNKSHTTQVFIQKLRLKLVLVIYVYIYRYILEIYIYGWSPCITLHGSIAIMFHRPTHPEKEL